MSANPNDQSASRPWGTIRQRGNRYYVRFTADARQMERGPFTSWNTADKMRRRAQVLIEAGTPVSEVLGSVFGDVTGTNLTFEKAAPLYLEAAADRKRSSTLVRDTQRLSVLLAAPWAKERLVTLRPAQILRWVGERTRGGAAPSTLNRDLSLGSALYRWAKREGYVTGNPFREVERFSEKGRARTTHLEPEEARALLASASPALRPVIEVALGTGMRLNEVASLQWRHVSLDAGTITVEAATNKTGEEKVIPLSPQLVVLLTDLQDNRPRPALHDVDPVFTRENGREWKLRAIQKAVRALVDACDGIPAPKRAAVSFHVFRHTAATWLRKAGVTFGDIGGLLGQKVASVTERYAHYDATVGKRTAKRLAGVLSKRA